MTIKELRAFIEGKSDDLIVNIQMIPNFQVSLAEPVKSEEVKVEEVKAEEPKTEPVAEASVEPAA